MPDDNSKLLLPPNSLKVLSEETGMKLLRFLERRLEKTFSGTMLHKWIRTGQVRVNGRRAKSFDLLADGDIIRLPPFAVPGSAENIHQTEPVLEILEKLGVGLIAHTKNLLAVSKPAGLPTQPGTGQTDSLSEILSRAWSGTAYRPSPAHRLDRHTSGVVLCGLSHIAQRELHTAFTKTRNGLSKYYLAVITGKWPFPPGVPVILADRLIKTGISHSPGKQEREGMSALPGGMSIPMNEYTPKSTLSTENTAIPHENTDGSQYALSMALALPSPLPGALLREKIPGGGTLMLIRLITGRTHQIRVQMSSRGHPLVGDGRYGGPSFTNMLLHAWKLSFKAELALKMDLSSEKIELSCPPPWPENFLPEITVLENAFEILHNASPGSIQL